MRNRSDIFSNSVIRRWAAMTMLVLGTVFTVYAAGTPAGTVIRSRSMATYSTLSGTRTDTVYSGYVSIVIAQVGAVNILPAIQNRLTASDSVLAEFAMAVTNSGNGTDAGLLTASSSHGWTVSLYRDGNGDGVLQAAEENIGTIGTTGTIAADGSVAIIVRVQVPRGEALNNAVDTTLVTVTSGFDESKRQSGMCITTVKTAVLSAAAGLSVDNPNPNAGAMVTYTFTLQNSGAVPATGVSVTDLLPVGLTFVSANTTQGSVNTGVNPVEWNLGTIPPGSSAVLTLTLRVNVGTAPGSVINNGMDVRYTVGGKSFQTTSNVRSITVGGAPYGVAIVPFASGASREPNDTAVYRFDVRNIGSFTDIIRLTAASSRTSFVWHLAVDANANNVLDAADPAVTASDSLAAGDSLRLMAWSIVPRFSTDLLTDTLRITAASAGDGSKSTIATMVTTVLVPVVTITNAIAPLGDQPAGTEMTYTITYTNSGSAAVSDFSIIDAMPKQTSYVLNSIRLNGTAILDSAPNVSFTDGTNGTKVVSMSLGTLNAKSGGTVQFKVKVQ